MKRVALITAVLIMAAICRPAAVSGQEQAQPFWPALTADELVVAPSPEAGKLPEVRQAEVDLSTGTATLSYPLAEWSIGSYPMQIGLTYRVGAFTTDEEPGLVALGWSMNGTGSVDRTVVGQPDELRTFELRTAADADVGYINDLTDYRKDASLDRYSYSCPGGSGQFVIAGGEIVQTPKSNNVIELIGASDRGVRDFRVTTPDGTRYEFTERELSTYRNQPFCMDPGYKLPDYTAVTTWLLSRIILPEGSDTIRYEYTEAPMWERKHYRPTESITMRNDPGVAKKYAWLPQGISDETININHTIGVR